VRVSLTLTLTLTRVEWTIERHLLYPRQFRNAVFTMFLIHQYHQNSDSNFGLVPMEMLLEIVSHLAHDLELQWLHLNKLTPEYRSMSLINACSSASIDKLTKSILTQPGVDVNCEVDSLTPLCAAARNNHEAVVSLLLQHQANVNHVCSNSSFALREACRYKHYSVVSMLLTAKADTNLTYHGESILTLARDLEDAKLEGLIWNAVSEQIGPSTMPSPVPSPTSSRNSSRSKKLHPQCRMS
jgi:hypothetical protein